MGEPFAPIIGASLGGPAASTTHLCPQALGAPLSRKLGLMLSLTLPQILSKQLQTQKLCLGCGCAVPEGTLGGEGAARPI